MEKQWDIKQGSPPQTIALHMSWTPPSIRLWHKWGKGEGAENSRGKKNGGTAEKQGCTLKRLLTYYFAFCHILYCRVPQHQAQVSKMYHATSAFSAGWEIQMTHASKPYCMEKLKLIILTIYTVHMEWHAALCEVIFTSSPSFPLQSVPLTDGHSWLSPLVFEAFHMYINMHSSVILFVCYLSI